MQQKHYKQESPNSDLRMNMNKASVANNQHVKSKGFIIVLSHWRKQMTLQYLWEKISINYSMRKMKEIN